MTSNKKELRCEPRRGQSRIDREVGGNDSAYRKHTTEPGRRKLLSQERWKERKIELITLHTGKPIPQLIPLHAALNRHTEGRTLLTSHILTRESEETTELKEDRVNYNQHK